MANVSAQPTALAYQQEHNLEKGAFYLVTNSDAGAVEIDYKPRGAGGTTWKRLAGGVLASGASIVVDGDRVEMLYLNTNVGDVYIDEGFRNFLKAASQGLSVVVGVNPNLVNEATTSTTYVSTGIGVGPISPKTVVALLATAQLSIAGAFARIAVFRNATGVPAFGTAVGADTQIGLNTQHPNDGGAIGPVDTCLVVDAAPTGGAVYYYLALLTQNAADGVTLMSGGTYNSSLEAVYA